MPASPIRLRLDPSTRLDASKAIFEAAVGTNRLGAECPCCDRVYAVRRRALSAPMAGALMSLYGWRQEKGVEYAYTPDLLIGTKTVQGGDPAKLRHWGLTERRPGKRHDGASQHGWWRITDRGCAFVEGLISVPSFYLASPKSAVVAMSDELITFREAMRVQFDYDELLSGGEASHTQDDDEFEQILTALEHEDGNPRST